MGEGRNESCGAREGRGGNLRRVIGDFRLCRDRSTGDEGADSVAASYREEEVRGVFGIVVDADA